MRLLSQPGEEESQRSFAIIVREKVYAFRKVEPV
jgi:hypothetical protein